MTLKSYAALARVQAGSLVLLAAGAAMAGQLSAYVTVKVRPLTTSGACAAFAQEPGIGVACQAPYSQGPLLPPPGAVAYQRAATIEARSVATEPLPVYTDGTKITGWRVVTLDNARYVELTIAW